MQYRRFRGLEEVRVSALGFGCMRFPETVREGKKTVDRERASAMIRRAIDCGGNSIDTAYSHHDGESETQESFTAQRRILIQWRL